jgi:hypothetical protein
MVAASHTARRSLARNVRLLTDEEIHEVPDARGLPRQRRPLTKVEDIDLAIKSSWLSPARRVKEADDPLLPDSTSSGR